MMSMLVVAVFFSMVSRAIFSPLMPSLQAEMGISLATVGMLFLLVSVSYAASMLLIGFIAARIGHGNTIVTALLCIALGLLVTAVAPNVLLLAFGLLLIGGGAGAYPPSGLVMISTKISIHRRSTAFAIHEIGPNLALLLAPLIVLAMEPWLGWRGILVLMALVCGLSAIAFLRWGAADSGIGTAPDLSTIRIILKFRGVWVGMVILSASLAGIHGVYAILPAYLVSEHSLSPQYVNFLLTISRVTSVLLLLFSAAVISRIGRRNMIIWVLLFSSLFTALIGLAKDSFIPVVVVAQPTFLAVMIPALLSSVADIGENRYQNLTYAIIITAGVGFGAGLVPALIGLFGDFGLGWLGFVALASYMVSAIVFLLATPTFGKS